MSASEAVFGGGVCVGDPSLGSGHGRLLLNAIPSPNYVDSERPSRGPSVIQMWIFRSLIDLSWDRKGSTRCLRNTNNTNHNYHKLSGKKGGNAAEFRRGPPSSLQWLFTCSDKV